MGYDHSFVGSQRGGRGASAAPPRRTDHLLLRAGLESGWTAAGERDLSECAGRAGVGCDEWRGLLGQAHGCDTDTACGLEPGWRAAGWWWRQWPGVCVERG